MMVISQTAQFSYGNSLVRILLARKSLEVLSLCHLSSRRTALRAFLSTAADRASNKSARYQPEILTWVVWEVNRRPLHVAK